MQSLESTYNGKDKSEELTRKKRGLGLSVSGGIALFIAILLSSLESLQSMFSLAAWQAWEISGVVGGVGALALLSGVFLLLPNVSTKSKRYFVYGFSLFMVSIILFTYIFPHQWHGDTPNYSPIVLILSFTGLLLLISVVAIEIGRFKTRNNPGGTAKVFHENSESGEEEEEERLGMGIGGVFGDEIHPSEAKTQTNREN